jgi:hypothetical protein
MIFLTNSNSILQIFHTKTSINNKVYYLGASTIILSKDIDKYAFMCSLNFCKQTNFYKQTLEIEKNIWIPIFGHYLKKSMTGLRGIFLQDYALVKFWILRF